MAIRQQRVIGRWITGITLAVIAAATLLPRSDQSTRESFWCVFCGDFGTLDFLLNTVLFVPLGAGLVLAGVSRRNALVIAVAVTVTVELLQWRTIAGRDATFGDLVANSTGAFLGILIASAWRDLIHPSVGLARALGVAALAAWVGIVAIGALGVRPAPTRETFFAQRTPRLAHLAVFNGELLDARIANRPAVIGPMANTSAVASAMHTGLPVEARVLLDAETPGPAPVVSVYDRRRHQIFLLGQLGDDAIFRARLAAQNMRLRAPGVRVRDALAVRGAGSAKDTALLRGHVDGDALRVEVARNSRKAVSRLPLTAGLGWTFIVPTALDLDARWQLLNALWLAALIAPAAYWLAQSAAPRSRRSAITGAALAVIALSALALVPTMIGVAATRLPEWTGLAAGLAGGWAAGGRAMRARARR
ncbi:MAG: VanZ family protein [Gemmatimonadaceae bacterium]